MGPYDDLLIDAPFWPHELIEVDYVPFPKAAVSALAGFAEFGDQIQVIEGLGSLGAPSAADCTAAAAVAGLVGTLGSAACMALSSKTAREQCAGIVGAGAGVGGSVVMASMGCSTQSGAPRVTVDPRVVERQQAEMLRQQVELRRLDDERRREEAAAKSKQTMMLVGGGIAAASLIAVIALRR